MHVRVLNRAERHTNLFETSIATTENTKNNYFELECLPAHVEITGTHFTQCQILPYARKIPERQESMRCLG